MGFFSDLQGISEIKKLKKGELANLSMSQIVNMIISLPDAQKNLSHDQYEEVYTLFQAYRKCKTKLQLDMDGYLDAAVKIVKSFNNIAPYEKYSGANSLEISFMMQEINDKITEHNIQEELFDIVNLYSASNDDYIDYIMKNGQGITRDNAKAFVGILITHERRGKQQALHYFDLYIKYLFNASKEQNEPKFSIILKASFLRGLLISNGILTKEECDALSKEQSKYL